MITIRSTGRQDQHLPALGLIASLALLVGFVPSGSAAIGNGTTAGKLRTTAAVTPKIAGLDQASLGSTDDLWDLTLETDTTATQKRAYWLYSDGTFDAGSDAVTSDDADALALLPAVDESKSVIGVYVAGNSCDFDDVGGLAAQGTISNQIPDGAYIGVPGVKYTKPATVAVVPV